MKFEFNNNIPIYIQIVDQMKKYIISRKIKPGEKLLSVRELALQTQVNPNTMQKALLELEDLKLVYTERTNGKYITKDERLIEKLRLEYADTLTNKYLSSMKDIGFNSVNTIEHLKKIGKKK